MIKDNIREFLSLNFVSLFNNNYTLDNCSNFINLPIIGKDGENVICCRIIENKTNNTVAIAYINGKYNLAFTYNIETTIKGIKTVKRITDIIEEQTLKNFDIKNLFLKYTVIFNLK